MMNEADILAGTYYDKCNITRKTGLLKDPVTKQSRQERVTISVDVPCALSTPTGGSVQFLGGHGRYHSGYTLFCRPEVDVQAGDRLEVITAAGRSYTLWTGRPFTYSGSHTEVPLSEDEPT